MILEQLLELHSNLDDLYDKGVFINKFIVVFGSNEPAERIIDYLKEKKISVNAMIDNNDKKYVFTYHGVNVYKPESLISNYNENTIILIASKYYQEMLGQLQGFGYHENKQVFCIVDMQTGRLFSLEDHNFIKEIEQAKRGTAILKRMKEEYGYDTMIFIFPWQAIGDIYMAAGYLKAYIEKFNIKKYLITVVGKIGKQIAMQCGFTEVIVLTREKSYELSRIVIFLGLKATNTMIVHHCLIHTNLTWKLGNYKGITFDDHFRHSIYGLDDKVKITEPPKSGKIDYIEKVFAVNGFTPGKTVILSPYANTITNPSEEFWINLVEKLNELGYTVCTNSSGKSEPAINGTKPILFGFNIIVEAIEFAGMFIGLRSGLCDYIASANAKKIIIYPDRIYNNGPVIDFFSLKRMNLTDNVYEIVYNEETPTLAIDKIMNEIGNKDVGIEVVHNSEEKTIYVRDGKNGAKDKKYIAG